MFINCQECNTTFRLDERLLKPAGSKVRCSQCLHTFIAFPPSARTRKPAPLPKLEKSRAPAKPAPRIIDQQAQELEGIDFSELDAMLEGGSASGKKAAVEVSEAPPFTAEEEPGGSEPKLELEAALEPEEPGSAESTASQLSLDEIDLDMDFEIDDDQDQSAPGRQADSELELDLDQEPQSLRAPAGGPSKEKEIEEELDLALDKLDLEPKKEKSPSAEAKKPSTGDDLDLVDLELDLNGAALQPQPQREEQELSLDDGTREGSAAVQGPTPPSRDGSSAGEDTGLDLGRLGLELEDKTPADGATPEQTADAAAAQGGDEEIDLSDLDALLAPSEEKKDAETPPEALVPAAADDPGLELQLDVSDTGPEAEEKKATEDQIEELELELDSESVKEQSGAQDLAQAYTTAPRGDEEMDLSDIEAMLGKESAAAKPKASETLAELGREEGGEIDLTEIESAIDKADEVDTARSTIDAEIELDLDLAADAAAPAQPATGDLQLDTIAFDGPQAEELKLELETRSLKDSAAAGHAPVDGELDLSDLADLVESSDAKAKSANGDSGDIELEFQIEGDEAAPASFAPAKTAGRSPAPPVEEELEALGAEEKPAGPTQLQPKRSRAGLFILLIVLVLAGGAYGLYFATTQMGMEIPYLSEYLQPKPADPSGTLNLSTLEINSKFIENSQSGRLFVITGKVRNGYTVPRSMTRLQGKLFGKGKVLVKNEFSYAGIVINDQDLASLSIAEVKQRLSQDGAVSLKPGQQMPFMLVFSDLPAAEQLDEFAVEIVSSVPGK